MPNPPHRTLVDVRGPRFAAGVTTGALIAVLVLAAFSPATATVLLAAQAVVFLAGAITGPRNSPYGLLFRILVAPRLGPVTETEPTSPLKFAQAVGFTFAALGVAGFLAGAPAAGAILTGFALFAAFLNAFFGICLGCQMYPLVLRLLPARPDPA